MEANKKFCINCGNVIFVKEGQKVASCSKCGQVISLEQDLKISADSSVTAEAVQKINEDIKADDPRNSQIKLLSINCGSCGGQLTVKEGQKIAQCPFCGSRIAVDDGSRRIEVANEAQKVRNEFERQELEKQKAAHEAFEKYYAEQKPKRVKWRIAYAICAVILYILIVLMAYIGYDSDGGGLVEKLVLVILGYFLFMPIILAVVRPHLPSRANDKADTSKVKSMLLTWLLYLGVVFLAAVTCAVIIASKE